MAYTPVGKKLTEAHRTEQARIGTRLTRQLLAAWYLIDPNDIETSTRNWLSLVLPTVLIARRDSAVVAGRYVERFRVAELGGMGKFRVPPPDGPDIERIRKSLIVTGPGKLQSLVRAANTPERAEKVARASSARAAQRHALDGGRDHIRAAVEADRGAVGWARVTSSSCCHFCAMLAARGGIYKSEKSGGFDPHDGCNCTVEPMYRRAQPLPGPSEEYLKLWYESTEGLSGADARIAFRRAIEGREPPAGWEPRRTASTRARPPKPGSAGGKKQGAPKVDPAVRARAELSALEDAREKLLRRQRAGEDVSGPLKWQDDRIARLRASI